MDIKHLAASPDVGSIVALAAVDGSPEGVAKEAEKYRSSDELHFYGWLVDGQVLGICGFEVHADNVEIHLIAVVNSRQRQGIGAAMVTALQKKYARPIIAETVEEAIGFYQKQGFALSAHPHPDWGWKYTCYLQI